MNPIKKIFFILFIFQSLYGQKGVKLLAKETISKINSIDFNYENDDDLKAIGDAIGNSTIVMLGEQDHGDAPTFLAKTRLIKYLHEKKGFNVLAFESDFFALNTGWESINKQTSELDSFLRKNIYPIWTRCDACSDLFYNYIPATQKTDHPIIISGFDNQVYLNYSRNNLTFQLDNIIRSLELKFVEQPFYTDSILPLIDDLIFLRVQKDSTLHDKIEPNLIEIRKQALEKLDSNHYWIMILDNLIALNQELKHFRSTLEAYNIRDKQMAKNLKWLKEVKFPNEKIIVWAHNYHICKYTGSKYNQWGSTSMGGFISTDETLNKQTYILGFTSYSGTAGRLGGEKYDVITPRKYCLEYYVPSDFDFAFIDFHKSSTPDLKFGMKGYHHFPDKAKWMKLYDGFFFIRNMYPCTKIQ